MRSSELQQLLERHRQILPMGTRERLLFAAACVGAGLWCLGPVLVPTTPSRWYLLAAALPPLVWVGTLIWRRHLIRNDSRWGAIDADRFVLQRADLRLLWPNDDEARRAPWQRPLIVLAGLFFVVCSVVGVTVVLASG